MTTTEVEARRYVAGYLAGTMNLRQLDEQIAPIAWDASVDPLTREFVNAVLLHVAEYEQGHRTEAELHERLRYLVSTASLESPLSNVVVQTGSSATLLVPGVVISSPQFADTRRVGVFS